MLLTITVFPLHPYIFYTTSLLYCLLPFFCILPHLFFNINNATYKTVAAVAKEHDLDESKLVLWNKTKYPGLTVTSRLWKGTRLALAAYGSEGMHVGVRSDHTPQKETKKTLKARAKATPMPSPRSLLHRIGRKENQNQKRSGRPHRKRCKRVHVKKDADTLCEAHVVRNAGNRHYEVRRRKKTATDNPKQ